MKKIFLVLTILFLTFSVKTIADTSNSIQQIYEGNEDAKVTIITYESLTCGHCADFHNNVYPKLKKEFIDTGLVKIEFRHFPLDMAALNASKIAQCNNDGKSELLHFLFSNQKKWVIGETVEAINENLKKLLKNENIVIDFEKCTNNKNIEDYVLNDRIEGVKKFKVNATPTIIINNKKFDKPLNYKNLKKSIEKLI
jgi:protein-disulfide isomerase